jgi:O-antigen ligase
VTDASRTIGIRPATRSLHSRLQLAGRSQDSGPAVRRAGLFIALCALAGIVLPAEVQITLADGVRFTPGRLAAALFFFPALFVLLQKDRRFMASDVLACSTAVWMIVACLISVGTSALSSAGGDALDFLGGYLIARAFVFGRPALDTFVRVLRIFAFVVIVGAMADSFSGRWIVHETIAAIVNASVLSTPFRNGMVRAASTFDHEILFGIFCAVTAAILLYWEPTSLRRSLAGGFCLLGCLLSLSSASLMAFAIVIVTFSYDQLMKRYRRRWVALWMVTGAVAFAFFVAVREPLSWILSHLTLDAQTGYFRMMIWQMASDYIAQSPITGYAYQQLNNPAEPLINQTVDSIWLISCLRFGIPMAILFFFTNVAAFFPGKRESLSGADEEYMGRMRRAFTLAIVVFMFAGLTVHFWNYMLMFWGLCIGIRASLRESSIGTSGRFAHQT